MSPITTGCVGIFALLVLMAIGMPIGVVMAVVGFIGTVYLVGLNGALGMISMTPYNNVASYTLTCVPMFILMGAIVLHSGLAAKLYVAADKWFGNLPGGLGVATVIACGLFGAISGSSLAATATIGNIALAEMNKYSYNKSFSAGIVAAGGTIAVMIPPSMPFIIYGIITEQSIGALFMAGIIPGILQVIIFAGTILIVMKFRPNYAVKTKPAPFREKFGALPGVGPILVLFLLVIGGMYLGIFTPTEGGAIGAAGALVISIVGRWFNGKKMISSLTDTARTTGMILFIVVGAMIYSYFLAVTNMPFAVANYAVTSPLPPQVVLVFILILYLILGCFMDTLAMLLLTVPIFGPVLFTLGFNPIFIGVLIILEMEIAGITPPVGMNVYVIRGIAKDVPMEQIFQGVIPFFIGDIILLAFLFAFPQICLFLPSMMYKLS